MGSGISSGGVGVVLEVLLQWLRRCGSGVGFGMVFTGCCHPAFLSPLLLGIPPELSQSKQSSMNCSIRQTPGCVGLGSEAWGGMGAVVDIQYISISPLFRYQRVRVRLIDPAEMEG